MLIANSSEHQINWNVKLNAAKKSHGGQDALKSIGNMVFLRGDGVYDKQMATLDQQVFGLGGESSGLYTSQQDLCSATGLRTYRDSLRLFGHEKTVCVLSNNQSHVPYLERTLRKGT